MGDASKYVSMGPVASSVPYDNESDPDCKLTSETVEEALNELCAALRTGSAVPWNNILTHERNPAGTKITAFEKCSATHIEYGPLVVIDNAGNVVVKG